MELKLGTSSAKAGVLDSADYADITVLSVRFRNSGCLSVKSPEREREPLLAGVPTSDSGATQPLSRAQDPSDNAEDFNRGGRAATSLLSDCQMVSARSVRLKV
jgi:hypothetical protein